ncbi:Uncharacterized protein dnm_038010 [Desulfonema magnum]|uniref:Uncharacterized protein n=1 Tax=Desulfonema magnum TaxID=45655 RepID=A0A975GNH1_9BACT|nr:Uncharacterized protein dnm_038010 [Desulfonema magnum]
MHNRTKMTGISVCWKNCFRKSPGRHFGISVFQLYEFTQL